MDNNQNGQPKKRSKYHLLNKRHKGHFIFMRKKNRAVKEMLKEGA